MHAKGEDDAVRKIVSPSKRRETKGVTDRGQGKDTVPPSLKHVQQSMEHVLDRFATRMFCMREFFYSEADRAWRAQDGMQGVLDSLGVGGTALLQADERWAVRSLLSKKPRRLSTSFLRDSRVDLHLYRKEYYATSGSLAVAQRVSAIHPESLEIHDGNILSIVEDSCRVQFDRTDLGVRAVPKHAIVAKQETPVEQFEIISEYYQPIFERIYYDDYPKRSRDIEQLKTIIAEYDSLAKLVDDTALDPPESVVVEDSTDRLVLSTIHSAKGLEWETVFIISLAEGKFPVSQALPGEQWEEERRLLYVAATRAKKNLYMTYPREVMSVDRQFSRAKLTPFLAEISHGLYISSGRAQSQAPGYGGGRSSGYSFSMGNRGRRSMSAASLSQNKKELKVASALNQGQAVMHPFFGRGIIAKVTGERTVEVDFDRHGRKALHLDYAKLEKVK